MSFSNQTRYSRIWLTTVTAGLGLVVIFNAMIDPIGAFPALHFRSLEAYRPRADKRLAKAELACRPGWDIVLLGSSRVLSGLPADDPLFRSNRTVNLALPAAVLPELQAALRTVLENNGRPPRMVILGVDYHMLADGVDHLMEFPETRFNPDLKRLDYYAKRLLGLKATEDSIEVLKNLVRRRALMKQDQDGFMNHRVGDDFSHRRVFDLNMRAFAPGLRAMPGSSTNRLGVLRQIIRECRERNIEVKLVLMPSHALEFELLHACGKGESFEEFKRTLVRFLADENLEGKVPLLDATGYAGPLAEEIPSEETHGLVMKYFVENSHATPALGELVLNTLTGVDGTNQFGVFLTRTNIENHLRQQHLDREVYLRTHPVDGQWPHRIVASLPPLTQHPATNGPAKNP